jgi:histidyl-tRNA synthetase
MKPKLAKGTRDLLPQDCIILQEVVNTLKNNFEAFGFNPIQTPIIERQETLTSKFTGGEEILKEMYKLSDQGKRELALRYDLTVPFSRFVAMNPQLKLPFKRYQIGRVYRDGPMKANRYREFTQCDCDVVGSRSIVQDAECVELFLQCFKDLDLVIEVRVNNRKILDEILDKIKIKTDKRSEVILAIDKLDKKPKSEVKNEIKVLGVPESAIKNLFEVIEVKGSNKVILSKVEKLIGKESPGIKEMKELLAFCPYKNVKFVPSLARGFSYYTGTLFEVYSTKTSVSCSIGSGGRYDKMIGSLMGSKVEFPAVGCSFGLDVCVNAIKEKRKSEKKSVVDIYLIPVGVEYKDVWPIVKELRKEKIKLDIGTPKKGVTKNLNYANSYGIPYVVLVGEDELKKGKLKLKNMETGSEKILTLKQLFKYFK